MSKSECTPYWGGSVPTAPRWWAHTTLRWCRNRQTQVRLSGGKTRTWPRSSHILKKKKKIRCFFFVLQVLKIQEWRILIVSSTTWRTWSAVGEVKRPRRPSQSSICIFGTSRKCYRKLKIVYAMEKHQTKYRKEYSWWSEMMWVFQFTHDWITLCVNAQFQTKLIGNNKSLFSHLADWLSRLSGGESLP